MSTSNGNSNNGNGLAKKTALVPQRNGGALNGGALLPGGVPGNKGGPGVTPHIVRARARSSFYERIPQLEKIADHPASSNGDVINAIDKLARYGLVEEKTEDITTHPEVRRFLAAFHTALTEEATAKVAARVRARVEALLNK
ncbi:MAG TPA: hypothetical protein VNM48_00025 [Chloroflexota bacterium]|nr:hypothetical protein [Chloroflexota bacterium]